MVLSKVVNNYEDDMVCDLAEYYHIFFYREYPCRLIATLVNGLREESRVRRRINNVSDVDSKIIMAGCFDRLSLLVWSKTKDAQKGHNPPASLLDIIMKKEEEQKNMTFDNIDEFMKIRNKIIRKEE